MWNDQTETRLREMWNAGNSASLIAIELNTTRNAIIGKAARLGLGKHITRHSIAGSYDRPRRSAERKPRQPRDRQPPKPRRVKRAPERTKSELYAMLAQAVRNTVALQA